MSAMFGWKGEARSPEGMGREPSPGDESQLHWVVELLPNPTKTRRKAISVSRHGLVLD